MSHIDGGPPVGPRVAPASLVPAESGLDTGPPKIDKVLALQGFQHGQAIKDPEA